MENSSSSLLWLWILLGILALCCLLSLCGGGLAACMGGKKKEKKVEEGDPRQHACSCACGVARCRGAARVVAYGTPVVGAIHDDADGSTDDGGDDADGRTRSFSDADDGQRSGCSSFPSDSNARDRWVRSATMVVDHAMMRTTGGFPTRSTIDVSGTRSVFSDGVKACGQSTACFRARTKLMHGPG